ncbi:protein kinase [Histoplasma capsulatum var. duboisii H88]|uniref:Protein kinase n=1 Tax=Ajellomyces capsulatus (strain H88) TaxID=544711 RepID=F0UJK9_AJEC8|nr:protein kinase [Histoplasma capsulatum var. duboisii H88]
MCWTYEGAPKKSENWKFPFSSKIHHQVKNKVNAHMLIGDGSDPNWPFCSKTYTSLGGWLFAQRRDFPHEPLYYTCGLFSNHGDSQGFASPKGADTTRGSILCGVFQASGYTLSHFHVDLSQPVHFLSSLSRLLCSRLFASLTFKHPIGRYRWRTKRFVALKIINNNDSKGSYFERDIEDHIRRQTLSHRGRPVVRSCLDSFEVAGPIGKHLCLAYEPAREPLWIFQKRFASDRFPLPMAKGGLGNMYPQITDFGAATLLANDSHHGTVQFGTRPIQPDYYRAPEVALGCGWSFSADIWNLGVMAWNIIEGTELFSQVQNGEGKYDANAHLAELIALLGVPPKKLLVMSDSMSQIEWSPAITDERGGIYKNNRDYFGGPFFDGHGKFLYDDLIPTRKLEDTVPSLEPRDKETFLSFIKQMLAWLPEERKTARELMEHPFLSQ